MTNDTQEFIAKTAFAAAAITLFSLTLVANNIVVNEWKKEQANVAAQRPTP